MSLLYNLKSDNHGGTMRPRNNPPAISLGQEIGLTPAGTGTVTSVRLWNFKDGGS